MKRFVVIFLFLLFCSGYVLASEKTYIHPIDRQESECKQNAKTLEDWTKCTYIASRAWNNEVDKYYSLLYKKLTGDDKTNLFEDQKYWTLYKNYEIKLLNSFSDKEFDTKERLIYRTNQKKDIVKSRAEALRMYYIQTFPEDDKEKIQANTEYNPDSLIMRGLRYIGF